MLEAGRHPNIEILTCSEVIGVEGQKEAFRVKVLKRARCIKEEVCNACGECAQKCPSKGPDEFELGLKNRKAIHIYFPQGIPAVNAIDRERCLKFTKDTCGVCAKIFKKGAVDYVQWELAHILGVELGENRFFKTQPLNPPDTTMPGIFACGFCKAPADIPESVAQASAAAARAAEIVLKKIA